MKIPFYTRVDKNLLKRFRQQAKRLGVSSSDLIDIIFRETLPAIEKSKGLTFRKNCD